MIVAMRRLYRNVVLFVVVIDHSLLDVMFVVARCVAHHDDDVDRLCVERHVDIDRIRTAYSPYAYGHE